MGDLSAHFDTSEFVCHGHGVRGHAAHVTVVHPVLVECLERLRSIVGAPCVIVSGHRCVWWNRRQGGATRSQHIRGYAADLRKGYATVRQAEMAGFRGIGNSGQWATHVDVRETPARWSYS